VSAPVPAPSDNDPIITRGALRAAVWDIMIEGLNCVALGLQRPALLTQAQLAEQFQVSERTVYTFRHEGMPHVMLGDSPRYELGPCLAWLKARKQA
jgi:hypothetical protein